MSETNTETARPAGARRRSGRLDIEELSLEELTALAREIEDRRQTLIRENRNRITQEIKNRLQEVGLTPEDLFPALVRRTGKGSKNQPVPARRKVAPRYRGPSGETWTGQGFTPRWLAALEAEGHDKKEFLIE